MKIRFQADADLDEDIVSGLIRRERGVDFRTASETATVVTIEELLLIWTASEAEEWVNRIAVIPL